VPPSSGIIALGRPMRLDFPAASTMAGITGESYRIRAHERNRSAHPVSALRHGDGAARSGISGRLEAGSILGVPEVRAPLLVYISSARTRKGQRGGGSSRTDTESSNDDKLGPSVLTF
jgi:hypothetical protein